MIASRVLSSIAAYGLHPSNEMIIEEPLEPKAWQGVAKGIVDERLAALALEAVRIGNLPVTDEQLRALEWIGATADAKRAEADRCLVKMDTALRRSNLNALVLQGAATAALDYAAPWQRPYESISMLLAPTEFHRALAVLDGDGYRPRSSARHRRRRSYSACLIAPSGVAVDLYRPHVGGSSGGSMDPTSAMFGHHQEFEIHSCRLVTLTAEERLVTTCVRVNQEGPSVGLLVLRDLVQIALGDRFSMRALDHLAATWRVEAVVAEAICRAWQVLDVPDVVPISSWSNSYRPTRRDRGMFTTSSLRRRVIFGQAKGDVTERPISVRTPVRLAGPA